MCAVGIVCSWILKRDAVEDIVKGVRNLRGSMRAEVMISCTLRINDL
jgi:hypothetical protein